MRKNKVYYILNEMMGLDISYWGFYNNCANYGISYDGKRLLENWGSIIRAIRETRCHKIKEMIKDYNEDLSKYHNWGEWCKHRNLLILDLWITDGTASQAFNYKVQNEDYVKNLLTIENIEKYNNPIIFMVESNGWERETWRFGIDLKKNKDKLELIGKLYDRLANFKPIDQKLGYTSFSISNKIDEYLDINWYSRGSYLRSPIPLNGKLLEDKINEIINGDDDKVFDMLYKGGIENFVEA